MIARTSAASFRTFGFGLCMSLPARLACGADGFRGVFAIYGASMVPETHMWFESAVATDEEEIIAGKSRSSSNKSPAGTHREPYPGLCCGLEDTPGVLPRAWRKHRALELAAGRWPQSAHVRNLETHPSFPAQPLYDVETSGRFH